MLAPAIFQPGARGRRTQASVTDSVFWLRIPWERPFIPRASLR